MSKRTRVILILIAVAVAAYLVYRWYMNRQAANTGTADTTGMGSNLNSVAPELVGGSTGPTSGLTYTPGNTQVDINLPATNTGVTDTTGEGGGTDNGGTEQPPLKVSKEPPPYRPPIRNNKRKIRKPPVDFRPPARKGSTRP